MLQAISRQNSHDMNKANQPFPIIGKITPVYADGKHWNRYAFIEDIAVSARARGKGIGRQLINKAVWWAKQKGLCGLMLETQDTNLLASRFYSKLGFIIGAVDTMLYANFENAGECAVFWYMKF